MCSETSLATTTHLSIGLYISHVPNALGGSVKSGCTFHIKPDLYVFRNAPVPEYIP